MAIIYTYPIKAIPNSNDLVLISDSEDSNNTKQVKVSTLPGSVGAGVSSVTSANAAITIVDPTSTPVLTSVAYAGGSNIGHVPTGSENEIGKFLNGRGGWTTPPNTAYATMGASNSYAAGLVLAGAANPEGNFLRKDGTWNIPAGITFNGATTDGIATFVSSSSARVNAEVRLNTSGQMTFNGSVLTSGIKYDLTSATLRVGDIGENSGSIGLFADGLEKITVSPNSTTIADNHPLITKTTTFTNGYGNGAINAQSFSSASVNPAPIRTKVGGTAGNRHIEFYNNAGVVSGSISQNGSSAVAYNVSSDYRLKENVVEMKQAVSRIKKLKPSRFNFIVDGTGSTIDGFIAHEVALVVPEAITGKKDAADDEGNPLYQGIDQSKLVPLLVGAIKELTARIEALEA